jgi:hypothetical protein
MWRNNFIIQLVAPVILSGVVLLAACKPEDVPEISVIPEIELISLSPLQAKEFKDSLVFEIRYTDGDGDLGSNDQSARNLFITDNRVQLVHEFRIKQLAPTGANVPITGTLRTVLPNAIITDNSNQQTVNFSIQLRDRAGNLSNVVLSPDVSLTK